MNPRRFIIDTDTASDDGVAILLALRWPEVQVEAITVVFGNVPVEQGSINARYTVELCGAETPVYEGASRPLLREPYYAYFFHGPDGMGGMDYPTPQRPAASEHAVTELIRRFGQSPGEITLVTLGPLTNIALALTLEPRLANWVKACYVMGGAACTVGNITPAAEYNIWCDPEAARLVFQSGMKILMTGWELCRGAANLTEADMARIRAFDTPLAHFALDCNRQALQANRNWLSDPGLPLPDPVTMAITLEPAVCTQRSAHYVDVACHEELTRGMTVVDQLGVTQKEPKIDVCWAIDVALWKEMLYKALH
jgi:purine nucleosidase